MQRAEFDPRDVAQPHDRAAGGIGAHDDVARIRAGSLEPTGGVDLHLERRARRRRRLADLAGGDLDVLLGDRVLDVDRGEAEIGELVGIEPDAHRIAPLAENAGRRRRRAGASTDRRSADRRSCDSVTGSTELSGEVRLTISTKFGFCFVIVTPPWLTIAGSDDAACETRFCTSTAAMSSGIADLESDGDRRGAVVRARRGHVGHALDAVDLLFERRRHRVGDDLRRWRRDNWR